MPSWDRAPLQFVGSAGRANTVSEAPSPPPSSPRAGVVGFQAPVREGNTFKQAVSSAVLTSPWALGPAHWPFCFTPGGTVECAAPGERCGSRMDLALPSPCRACGPEAGPSP